MPALPILPSAALSSVSGGPTQLPSSALQADKIFSAGSTVSDWMEHIDVKRKHPQKSGCLPKLYFIMGTYVFQSWNERILQ
ncbi:hypothetical protein CBFG_02600 [Clostridiales bacterium 1_7_47FAA]|nr:hypothetical protein CBFG_02600 [Clostridiales bacterium 1_7_47FAA]